TASPPACWPSGGDGGAVPSGGGRGRPDYRATTTTVRAILSCSDWALSSPDATRPETKTKRCPRHGSECGRPNAALRSALCPCDRGAPSALTTLSLVIILPGVRPVAAMKNQS